MSPRANKQKSQNNQKKTVSPRKPNGGLSGKFLVKNKDAKLRDGSLRMKSFNKIHGHMSYEKAVEAGARPQDIRFMVLKGHLKATSK